MRIIAITPPTFFEGEASFIRSLLANGFELVHLRKPDASLQECRKLLQELTEEERAKIIIHDYPELFEEFSLKGIHINKRVTSLPDGYRGFKTRSCHSLEEVQQHKEDFDYLFLSPIFDSISKAGYKAAFTEDELRKASDEGIIDHRVVALGGITPDKLPFLEKMNFGGAAMMGGLYSILKPKH